MQQSACTACSAYRPCVSHVLAYTSVLPCSESLMLRDILRKVYKMLFWVTSPTWLVCIVLSRVCCVMLYWKCGVFLSWVVSCDISKLMYPFVGYVSWSCAASVYCSGLYMILYSSCKLFWVIYNLVCTVVLGCVQSCTAGVHCSGLCIIMCSRYTLFWARCITWCHTAAVDLGCVCHMILYSQCTWLWVVCDIICVCMRCSQRTALWPSTNLFCLLCREHTFGMGSWLSVTQSLNGS